MSFLDREAELALLDEIHARAAAQFVVVYGRRRIGKTSLLLRWVERQARVPTTYWVAQRSTSHVLLGKFSSALAPLLGISDSGFAFGSWEAAFAELAARARERQVIVVIDELPYLLDAVPALASVIQSAWDLELRNTRIRLIVAGSHQHMMERTFGSGRGPLFGRATANLLIHEIAPEQMSLFLPRYGPDQLVETHSVIGGVPKYLEMWNDRRPVLRNIQDQVLSPVSLFRHEPVMLIQDEIAEPRTYLAILEAIGGGAKRPVEIASATGIRLTHATKYLNTLRQLGLVRRIVSLDALRQRSSRKSQYEISDSYLGFHFRFVHPNLRLLEQGRVDRLMEIIRAGFDAHVGKRGFEEICRRHVSRLADLGGLPFEGLEVGRVWNRTCEIDVACLDARSRSALLGECRWRRQRMAPADLEALRSKVRLIPEARKWRIHLALFSRAGFTDALRKQAGREGVMLVEGIPLGDAAPGS